MRVMDLMPLKPYFHGTTSLTGAPFWLGRVSPYRPTASRVSGCMASSSRNPSTYGQARLSSPPVWPGISAGRTTDSNATERALPSGCACFSSDASAKPSHGMTIDHASTQRMR